MVIIQNAHGERCLSQVSVTEQRHLDYVRHHHCGGYFSLREKSPKGMSGPWSKIVAWIKALGIVQDGEVILGLDCDAVIRKTDESLDILQSQYNFGMVKVETEKGWWFNSGTIWIRKTNWIIGFLEELIRLGDIQGAEHTAEQARLNVMLQEREIPVQVLDSRYNSYSLTPCEDPVIAAFHGEKDELAVLKKMHAVVTPKP